MPDPSKIPPTVALDPKYLSVLLSFYAAHGLQDTIEVRTALLSTLKGMCATETPTIEKLHELELWFLTEHLHLDVSL